MPPRLRGMQQYPFRLVKLESYLPTPGLLSTAMLSFNNISVDYGLYKAPIIVRVLEPFLRQS